MCIGYRSTLAACDRLIRKDAKVTNYLESAFTDCDFYLGNGRSQIKCYAHLLIYHTSAASRACTVGPLSAVDHLPARERRVIFPVARCGVAIKDPLLVVLYGRTSRSFKCIFGNGK